MTQKCVATAMDLTTRRTMSHETTRTLCAYPLTLCFVITSCASESEASNDYQAAKYLSCRSSNRAVVAGVPSAARRLFVLGRWFGSGDRRHAHHAGQPHLNAAPRRGGA